MSALKSRSNSLAGLTLDAVLGGEILTPSSPDSPPSPPPLPENSLVTHHRNTTSQTLFDIIREEYHKEGHKDRTTWQIFREKLRLKRTGSAWTSSLHIPASDILIPNPKHLAAAFRSQSAGLTNDSVNLRGLVSAIPMSDPPGSSGRAMFSRGSSMRIGSSKNPDDSPDVSVLGDGPSSRSFKPQLSRHDSVRDHSEGEEDNRRRHPVVTFVEERQMSAREAVAAQEAAEAAAVGSDDEDDDDNEEDDDSGEAEEKSSAASAPKQTMSLMDLLEETDRQMGLTGSRYAMDDEEEYEEEEEEDEEEDGHGGGEGELSCCVCQVKIKGASFTPCGHTFCKLCSKELMAQKGHCPVCSSFVLEFLEIF
uniref:Postreplication repair E3 ubiquitin-protein ligase RAD18 n=1 Tax=Noccaea caerulescens TaxID=107243 RepID=A0A1J3FNM2_NOCCA